MTPEKGIVEAIEVALASGRHLKIAAKVGPTPHEQDYNRDVFEPALKRPGSASSSSASCPVTTGTS